MRVDTARPYRQVPSDPWVTEPCLGRALVMSTQFELDSCPANCKPTLFMRPRRLLGLPVEALQAVTDLDPAAVQLLASPDTELAALSHLLIRASTLSLNLANK